MRYLREGFWATTSNKQLNFLQHVRSLLTINGRAAVVLPDNVPFEGGAAEVIRRKLLAECDVHTLLCLPTSIFYAGGVKANVLFFGRKPPSEKPWTDKLWIYDFRTNLTMRAVECDPAIITMPGASTAPLPPPGGLAYSSGPPVMHDGPPAGPAIPAPGQYTTGWQEPPAEAPEPAQPPEEEPPTPWWLRNQPPEPLR
jgi:hypothetical protein